MELTAVLRAVEIIEGSLEIISGSAYVVNCFQAKWWRGWRKNSWRKADGTPVANLDLLVPLIDAWERRPITVWKAKCHSGGPLNGWVRQLARLTAQIKWGQTESLTEH